MPVDTRVDYVRLADVVGEELIAWGMPANSCIAAARVCGFVLRELGVAGVEAMACEMMAASPAYVAMREQAVALKRGLTEQEVDEFVAQGAWKVEARFGQPTPGQANRRGGGYDGHVVTLVQRAWLIDPTAAQVNRPAKGLIVTPPFARPIDYDSARGHGLGYRSENGTVAVYRLLPGRKDFTKAGDWWRPKRTDPIVARILARLEHD